MSALVSQTHLLTMSVFTLHEQLRCHQFLLHSLTRNKFSAVCVVRVLVCVPLHMRVFLKFKLTVSWVLDDNHNKLTYYHLKTKHCV